jgi:putative copper resistance protein D
VTEAGLIAARFAHYAALVLAFGSFAYVGFGKRSPAVSRRLDRLMLGSSLLLLLTGLAVLAATVAGMGGGLASLSDATLWSAIIKDTDFGRVWMVRLAMAAILIAVGVAVWRRPARGVHRLGLLLAGGLLVTVALTGHAQAEEGASGMIHCLADAAHLLAAAVWLGVLPPLLLLLRRGSDGSVEDPELAAARLQAFHMIGLASVIVLALTGVVNSVFLVGSAERLVSTSYGRLLLTKLALFALMIGLAADNRLRLVPALSRDLARGSEGGEVLTRLRLHIRGELVVGMLVLAAVAVLGAIAPASV